MTTVRFQKTGFSSGEISPRVQGRIDSQQYVSGLSEMKNAILTATGSAGKRRGMKFIAEADAGSSFSRLIPFVSIGGGSWVIEVTETKYRFFRNGSKFATEITHTIFDEQTLRELDYAQDGNAIILVHEDIPPQRLILQDLFSGGWTAGELGMIIPPLRESSYAGNQAIVLSGNTIGTTVTATMSPGGFLPGDVGRVLQKGGGYGVITEYVSSTEAKLYIYSEFDSTGLFSGWEIFGHPDTGDLTFLVSGDPTPGKDVTITASTACFRTPDDVGGFMYVKNGWIKLRNWINAQTFGGTIVTTLDDVLATKESVIYLEASRYGVQPNYDREYFSAVAFHEGRLVLAGGKSDGRHPSTIYLSETGNYAKFSIAPNDADGVTVTLSGGAGRIEWIQSSDQLAIGTSTDERTLSGAGNTPITPSSLEAKVRSGFGSQKTKPVLLGRETVFMQEDGKTVRGISLANFDSDFQSYKTSWLSVFGDHLSSCADGALSLQNDRDTIVWMAAESGSMVGMTYSDQTGVLGWHEHYSLNEDESHAEIMAIAVIPSGVGRDDIYMRVRRDTGDFIEVMRDAVYLDSYVAYSGAPTTTISGLDHLEGRTVSVLADGATQNDKVVSGGQIELDREASEVYVGIPIEMRIVDLEPEGGNQFGGSQGLDKRVVRGIVRVNESGPIKINGDETPFRRAVQSMGSSPGLVTGDLKFNQGTSYGNKARMKIESNLPLPVEISMWSVHYEVNMK